MTEKGKVIQGLRDIKTYLECQALEASVAGNDLAREGFIESQGIIRDAIALLKEFVPVCQDGEICHKRACRMCKKAEKFESAGQYADQPVLQSAT